MSPQRIKQRWEDFNKALERLKDVLKEDISLSSAIMDGTIQRFEFSFELAWKLIQQVLEYKGIRAANPRAVIKEAYQQGLIQDGEAWVGMLEDRNTAAHTYDEKDAKRIYQTVKDRHCALLVKLQQGLEKEIAGIK